MCAELGLAKFQPSSARRTFSNSGLNGQGGGKCAFFIGKLAVSRKRWKIGPRLLLRWNENHRLRMTLKVAEEQYSQLS